MTEGTFNDDYEHSGTYLLKRIIWLSSIHFQERSLQKDSAAFPILAFLLCGNHGLVIVSGL
ncbi:MAG: hypothetical protein ACI9IP_003493 [Arcticibacterium sp.]|jgi:hypothetical protein